MMITADNISRLFGDQNQWSIGLNASFPAEMILNTGPIWLDYKRQKLVLTKIFAILRKFAKVYRDIWKIGINVSLRILDLLGIRYSEFRLGLENRRLKLRGIVYQLGKGRLLD